MLKFAALLTLILITLKLIGKITLSWWLIMLPIPAAFIASLTIVFVIAFLVSFFASKN